MKIKVTVPDVFKKLGKTKSIALLIALLVVVAGVVGFLLLKGSGGLTPAQMSYHYNFDQIGAHDERVDQGVTIDGKLDEEFWADVNFTSRSKGTMNFQVGTYFTDAGLYIGLKAVDDAIVWNDPFAFTKNTSFELYIASAEAVNDPLGGNIESTASHATEVFSVSIDSQSVKCTPTAKVFAKSYSTDTEMSCELFFSWEDLRIAAKPEQVRIWSQYRHIDALTGEGVWVYNGGYYTDPTAYYNMSLFDEHGSISESGTRKNTDDMTLGNSALGYAATDRWDLSGDTAEHQVRMADSNGSFHQVVYLKEAAAKNFEFEVTLQFLEDAETLQQKAGVIIADNDENKRLLVTFPGTTSYRLGDTIYGMYWVNSNTAIASSTESANVVTMRVVSYEGALYYFYRHPGDDGFSYAGSEIYEPLTGKELTVGLYSSSRVRFSDWDYESYDGSENVLYELLQEDIYFASADNVGEGEVELSEAALSKGDTLSITVLPDAGYCVDTVKINGTDVTADFLARAEEGVYSFTPDGNVDVVVEFRPFTEDEMASARRTYIIMTRSNGSVVSGVDVHVYPVTVTNSGYVLNEKSSVYYYRSEASSAGYANFILPYAGSDMYAEGTYLVKINHNSYFHYETLVTVTEPDEGNNGTLEIPVEIPTDLIIDGNADANWSIDSNGTITANPSDTGDGRTLAYFPETLLNGEISAEFTTSCDGGIYAGFGYRVASGSNIGKVGVIGVAYSKGNLAPRTYNYYGQYGGVADGAFSEGVTYAELVANGDIVENSDGSVTFRLRLVRAENTWLLYVGDTFVQTFNYGSDIQINSDTEVQLGLMFRTANYRANDLYTITNLKRPSTWNREDRQAVVSGSISGEQRDNLKIVLKGKNCYGVVNEQTIDVPVSRDGTYSFVVGDLADKAATYTVEFYQGDGVLRKINGKPVTLSLSAGGNINYDIVFNEFKGEYNIVMHMEGLNTPVRSTGTDYIGGKVTLPEVYTYKNMIYVLDREASAGGLSGTVTDTETLELVGFYKAGFAYSANAGFTVGSDKNGLTLTSSTTNSSKYILSEKASDAFEVTATFSGVPGGTELGSGFMVSDGRNHLTFMWKNWNGGLQVRDHYNTLYSAYADFGSLPAAYNATSNPSVRIKMAYHDRIFTFYLVEDGVETLISTFDLDQQSRFDKGEWTAETCLKVGFFSWNNSVSAVKVSDIEVEWPELISYQKEYYLPDGTLADIETVRGEVGTTVSIDGVYDNDGTLYLVDGTAPGDVAEGTLQRDKELILSGTLNKKAFEYGTFTNDVLFDVSENGNLVLNMTYGLQTYIYSKERGSEFTVKAKFTSTSPDCETGFSVMNESGEKLTFRLVSWNDSLAVIPDNNWAKTTYFDIGVGKMTTGRTVTLTMSYKDGTFTFNYNGKVTEYTNEYFEDDLYVGFLTYSHANAGCKVELLNCSFTYPKGKQSVETLFVGDSWIDTQYWTNFKHDYPDYSAMNQGLGGYRVGQLLNRVDQFDNYLKPENIVMHIGINDINGGRSAETVIAEIEELMMCLHEQFPETDIWWISLSPNNFSNYSTQWTNYKIVNEAIQEFANTNGKFHYIDFANVLCGAVGESYEDTAAGKVFMPYYVADGLHLNDKGYELFVATIKKALAGQ